MAGFSKAERQAIIDDYLQESGANQFVPGDFVDWLQQRPDHIAWPWFFEAGDEVAAREHRIGIARQMASGLRITAQVMAAPETSAPAVFTVREFPALISPVAGRKSGGGYQPFDPDDGPSMRELQQQGASALRSWVARYRGAAEAAGADLAPLEEIAALMQGRVAGAA